MGGMSIAFCHTSEGWYPALLAVARKRHFSAASRGFAGFPLSREWRQKREDRN